MADAVLTSSPERPVSEIKPPARPEAKKTTEQVFQEPAPFLPPKTPEEVASTEAPRGPGLTVTRPGEEPVFEPAEQRIWDARSQSYVEPYAKTAIPGRPDASTPAQKFPTRDEFERFAFEAIGGNPFEFDPAAEVQHATQDLRPLFNQVFGNKVYWGDRDRLDPTQQKFWDDTVKAYRAQIFNSASNLREQRIEVYNHMLSKYSDEVNEQKAAEAKVATQSKAVLAEAKERRAEAREERSVRTEERKVEAVERAERKEADLERAREYKRRQDALKGLKPKEPTRADVQAIAKAEFEEFDAVDAEDNFLMEVDETLGPNVYKTQLNPKILKSLNDARKAAGLPELHEIISEAPVDVSSGLRKEKFETQKRYHYLEAPEAEFDKEVKKQYPNAVRYGDAYWALLPNGQWRKIPVREG